MRQMEEKNGLNWRKNGQNAWEDGHKQTEEGERPKIEENIRCELEEDNSQTGGIRHVKISTFSACATLLFK